MFTGLIAEVGRVRGLSGSDVARLVVEVGKASDGVGIGGSVAVNGACLTVTATSRPLLTFDVVRETLKRTNLGSLRPGDPVNLERPLKAGDEFGGHFVLGHVDSVGRIMRLERSGESADLEIAAGDDIMKYVVEKGSIAIDGISLTVASLSARTFTVALVPHTLHATNLCARRVGDMVNIETDVLGKYVERYYASGQIVRPEAPGGADGMLRDENRATKHSELTEDRLREAGF
jgi:riboflavin synthase